MNRRADGYELQMQVVLNRMIGTVVPDLARLDGVLEGAALSYQPIVQGIWRSDRRAA